MFKQYRMQIETIQPLLKAYCEAEDKGRGEAKKVLIDYLNEQEMAFIQLVQVILYVGKNKTTVEEKTKEALYQNVMDGFAMLKGWRTKEIEVSQMIFQIPLDSYFEKGLKIFTTLE